MRATQTLAIFLCGCFAFLELYCVQPMLPMLAKTFHVTEAHVGITISASTIGVALSAFLLALFGERLRRKPAILFGMFALSVSGLLTATAHTLHQLAAWRFVQGIATPFIFIITIAYITEEWPARDVPRVMSRYVAGTVFGGFTGRFLGGYIAEHYTWQVVFAVLGTLGLAGAALVAKLLPHAHNQHSHPVSDHPLKPFLANFRNKALLATFLIGFCMLFVLIATFSFITFYLSLPPFNLTLTQLSLLFGVYLVGLVATIAVGGVLFRVGLRSGILIAVACGCFGIALTLVPSLLAVGIGLAILSSGIFVTQVCVNSFIRDASPAGGRVSATGTYICSYYLGGTVGGMLPGIVLHYGGWPACVALIAFMLVVAGLSAWFGWRIPVATESRAHLNLQSLES